MTAVAAGGWRRRRSSSPPTAAACRCRRRPGFAGTVTFGYTITDGRDASASANVTVEVRPSDGSANRPPEAHNDIASTRRGRPTTFDVLANDTDPDGDALVLDSIALEGPGQRRRPARARPVGPGRVHPRPEHDVGAHRADVHGQRRLRRHRRGHRDRRPCACEDANNEPDARNDAGVTVVGKPIRLDVLANDTDPDNDPLFVAQQPTLVRPTDRTIGCARPVADARRRAVLQPRRRRHVRLQLLGDRRRGDRRRPDPHRGRRAHREPAADGDPRRRRDRRRRLAPRPRARQRRRSRRRRHRTRRRRRRRGNGLTVKEVEGVGYLVTVAPGAPARPTFRYQISDGRSDPVGAVVVVAVTDSVAVDQPPVARADVVEVRAGGKVAVPVLANDYDPEGGALEVVGGDAVRGRRRGARVSTARPSTCASAPTWCPASRSATPSPTSAGNQSSAFLDVRIVPGRRGQPAADRPHRHLPHAQRRAASSIAVVANDSDPDGDIIAVESIRTQPIGRRRHASSAGRRRLHAERHVRRHRPLHVLARRRRRRDRHRRGARRRHAAGRRRTGRRRRSTTPSRRSPAARRSCSTCSTTTPTPTATRST